MITVNAYKSIRSGRDAIHAYTNARQLRKRRSFCMDIRVVGGIGSWGIEYRIGNMVVDMAMV